MTTIINLFTAGTDPEMFARRVDNGAITSVAGLLGCSKEKKLDLSSNVRLQEDNVLAEFDINPCENFSQFNESIQSGIDLTRALLATHGLDIAEGVSSHIYTNSELESFDKSAFVFGCTPDYNAMTGQKNPSPKAADPGLRTAGGHVHIGFPKGMRVMRETQMDAGVLCDYYLSLPSLVLDGDTRRKELYGKAGAIRFKEYGIEYRSLSNFWIFKEQLRHLIYGQVEKVVNELVTDKVMELNSILPVHQLQEIINTNDVRQAETYLSRFNII
jgi:hypothetical protein